MTAQLSMTLPERQVRPGSNPNWSPEGERSACFWLFYRNYGHNVPLPIIQLEVSENKYTQRISEVRAWIRPQGHDIKWNRDNNDPAYMMCPLTEAP